jgi:eukaryotic-like serine/threonine-protein kinase
MPAFIFQNGTRFGDYETVAFLKEGGFGNVYKAKSPRDGIVALKIIAKSSDAYEAELVGAMLQQSFGDQHSVVPKVYEIGETDRDLYIAMEYVDLPSLHDELQQKRKLTPDRAVCYVRRICEFLRLAHSFHSTDGEHYWQEIIHGDLKPAHIFISDDGIKVLDFGLASGLNSNRPDKTLRALTPPYASPQRSASGRGSKSDDLWAVGVMFFEMIAGNRPLAKFEPNQEKFKAALASGKREPVPATCPPGVARIIDRLLEHDERKRYGTAAEVLVHLDAYQRGTPEGPPPTIAKPQPRSTGRSQVETPPTTPRPARRQAAPRPITPPPPGGPPGGTSAQELPAGRSFPVRLRYSRRRMWMAFVAAVVVFFTSEAVAGLEAEQMRNGLNTLDATTVDAWRARHDRMETYTLLNVYAKWRLHPHLRGQLIAVADGIIADYRSEDPSVASNQWQQACAALAFAGTLSGVNRDIEAKQLLCAGHLDRIQAHRMARSAPDDALRLNNQAIGKFNQAANLEPRSPDPYLGLSRVYIYGLKDVERGAKAIGQAEERGRAPGWRERAQLGDGFWNRAMDEAKTLRGGLAPEARHSANERLRDAATQCIESYKAILYRGNAKRNSNQCQTWLNSANRALAVPEP